MSYGRSYAPSQVSYFCASCSEFDWQWQYSLLPVTVTGLQTPTDTMVPTMQTEDLPMALLLVDTTVKLQPSTNTSSTRNRSRITMAIVDLNNLAILSKLQMSAPHQQLTRPAEPGTGTAVRACGTETILSELSWWNCTLHASNADMYAENVARLDNMVRARINGRHPVPKSNNESYYLFCTLSWAFKARRKYFGTNETDHLAYLWWDWDSTI